jgi:hypothetical protein
MLEKDLPTQRMPFKTKTLAVMTLASGALLWACSTAAAPSPDPATPAAPAASSPAPATPAAPPAASSPAQAAPVAPGASAPAPATPVTPDPAAPLAPVPGSTPAPAPGAPASPGVAVTPAVPGAAAPIDMVRAKATFENLCGSCHETALATDARYNREGWKQVVERMFGFGMSATDEQAAEIVEYLTATHPAD